MVIVLLVIAAACLVLHVSGVRVKRIDLWLVGWMVVLLAVAVYGATYG